MGYIKHDAIIVTSSFRVDLEISRGIADELGLRPTGIVESGSNSYLSFLIPPDGSKEGWEESDRGEKGRAEWKQWAREARRRKTAAVYLHWVHVSYAGDEASDTMIVDHHKLHKATQGLCDHARKVEYCYARDVESYCPDCGARW